MKIDPLDPKFRKAVNDGLDRLSQLLRKIDMAEQAGFNVQEFRDGHNFFQDRYMQIKRTYWPNQP